MRLQNIILEARKTPKKNPKISINSQIEDHYNNAPLLKYDIKNSFVSFTSLEKLGVNPRSRYNTPYGIYCYPSSYVLFTTTDKSVDQNDDSEYKEKQSTLSMDKLPFAGKMPYGNIFSIKGNIVYLNNMTKYELKHYSEKLLGILFKQYPKHNILITLLKETITKASTEARHSSSVGGRFWYILWSMSSHIAIQTNTSKGAIIWNTLFRLLGIDAVIDTGEGIIHPSEPTQAVIFKLNATFNLKRVDNKYSDEAMLNGREQGQLSIKAISNIDNLDVFEIMSRLDAGQVNLINYIKDDNMLKKILALNPAILENVKNPTLKHIEYATKNKIEMFISIIDSMPYLKSIITEQFVLDVISKSGEFINMYTCKELCQQFPHYDKMLYALIGKNPSMLSHSHDIMDYEQYAKVKQYASEHNLNFSKS